MASLASSIHRARSLLLVVPCPQKHTIWGVPTVGSSFQMAQKCHARATRRKLRNDEVSYFRSTARKEDKIDSNKTFLAEPRSVPVQTAYKLLNSGHRYLDVRTRDEFDAGHTYGAINIPYMLQSEAGMLKNSKFLEEVSTQFVKDDKILIGCKSGRRSLMAAADLQSAGYTQVMDVKGGYSAWTENGLPTENNCRSSFSAHK